MNIQSILQIATVVLAILTIILVILNQPQTDSTFGGSNSFQITRRGAEKQLHNFTIISSVLLVVVILLSKIV
jgi:protein translocase SecG subunit